MKELKSIGVFWGQASNFLTINSFTPLKNIMFILVPTNDVFTSRENA